ncbi:putative ceramide-1-phosphate transfer protein-like [Scophthalmus maximus]|uniref:Putative ceramide-1-phosphate transfer protein-like n=1 Tax=Scophthalmus maximus TaxID=52904 RepID=A0A2U9B072_SCOMX|nr:putative ceramide-1-phosphate transfer protein-like [Scophthalmus maximus]
MVFLRRTTLLRLLLLAAMLALLLFVSSLWLPQGGVRDCGSAWQPCLILYRPSPEPSLVPDGWAESDGAPPLTQECPGQSFQVWRLLLHLKSSLSDDGHEDDVLLEPYLQSWDQLLKFMESLGTMVSFFSQKVHEKVKVIRRLSLEQSAEAYRSVRSMVEAELRAGAVDFARRTDSGCRTLLRLHRSLLWLKLMLEGLSDGPDADGQYKTPGELSRDAYKVALAPHHHWVLRQAAEFVFLAVPERRFFLQLVCVQTEREAAPVLRVIIRALALVHERTQRILSEHDMLELP